MHWKPDFLKIDDYQREVITNSVNIIRDQKGIHTIPWISGYAGNGKSVVLVYAMENIADLEPKSTIAFITYTHALKDLVQSSLLPKHHTRIHVSTHTNFISERNKYDYVFVDEIQDLSDQDLKKINALSGRTVFAGDFAQSIYPDNDPITQNQLKHSFDVKEYKLTKMYRLTKKIAEIVGRLIRNTFAVGLETGLQKEIPIRLFKFPTQKNEFDWVWEQAIIYSKIGQPSAILFPHKGIIQEFMNHICDKYGLDKVSKPSKGPDPYKSINKHLEAIPEEVNFQYFGKGSGNQAIRDARQNRFVLIMTYYSAKGLDFRASFLPSLNEGLWLASEKVKEVDNEIEKKVLFVALTRSREALFLSYSGINLHRLIKDLQLEPIDQQSGGF
jgi:superfamily I DNA/RNA helicase